jgi:hypothetical protein
LSRIPFTVLALVVAAAADPRFGERVYVEVNGHPLRAGTYTSPLVTDWNGDGLQDLLVGQFEYGRIRFYPNEGEPGAPVFTTFQYLLDDGVPLSVPYG